MSDSDGEYREDNSDDGGRVKVGGARRTTGRLAAIGKTTQSWDDTQDTLQGFSTSLQSAEDVKRSIEARKRARIRQDVKPMQRGIIRHLAVVLDMSEPMLETDMRPNRFNVVVRALQDFVTEFFEQNPISQLCLLAMHSGRCVLVSDMSGNANEHIDALEILRSGSGKSGLPKGPEGDPSLLNALEICRTMLFHTPNHGTREVVIILAALFTNDPGDIHATIASCVQDRLTVNIIGMVARMKICQDIVTKTNGGDDSSYTIALDQYHVKDLLNGIIAPPAIRENEQDAHMADLLLMGFPSKEEADEPSLCACHSDITADITETDGTITNGLITARISSSGYICPRCQSKVCSLPLTCPNCSMTLILSTHLARSYHHLFPLRNFIEVSWATAREAGSIECTGCLRPFPPIPNDYENDYDHPIDVDGDTNMNMTASDNIKTTALPSASLLLRRTKSNVLLDGASESSRYECQNCHSHFCVDCDVFCHQNLFNCPGCHS